MPQPFFDEPFVPRDLTEGARKYGEDFRRFTNIGGLPNTRTRLTHALTIRSGNGRVVGAISAFSPSQSRVIEDEFEVDAQASGMPIDVVPQVVNHREIRVRRYDLYNRLMEEAFGTDELIVLADQARPFSVREVWRGPSGVLVGGQRIYEYRGCWFSNIGRELTADGDRTSMADATLTWQGRDRVL